MKMYLSIFFNSYVESYSLDKEWRQTNVYMHILYQYCETSHSYKYFVLLIRKKAIMCFKRYM